MEEVELAELPPPPPPAELIAEPESKKRAKKMMLPSPRSSDEKKSTSSRGWSTSSLPSSHLPSMPASFSSLEGNCGTSRSRVGKNDSLVCRLFRCCTVKRDDSNIAPSNAGATNSQAAREHAAIDRPSTPIFGSGSPESTEE